MAAAKFMDAIARVPGNSGVDSDAVGAYIQVTLVEASKLLARTWSPPLGLVCHLVGGLNPGLVLKTLSVLFFSTFMAILWLGFSGKNTKDQSF